MTLRVPVNVIMSLKQMHSTNGQGYPVITVCFFSDKPNCNSGHSMLLDTKSTAIGTFSNAGFGKLISPVFLLKKSSHICSQLHYFLSPGSKGKEVVLR